VHEDTEVEEDDEDAEVEEDDEDAEKEDDVEGKDEAEDMENDKDDCADEDTSDDEDKSEGEDAADATGRVNDEIVCEATEDTLPSVVLSDVAEESLSTSDQLRLNEFINENPLYPEWRRTAKECHQCIMWQDNLAGQVAPLYRHLSEFCV